MKLADLEKILPHKKRTIKDLANYIMVKSGVSPNYSLFLGAGASVTSGVHSGAQLVDTWRKDIYTLLSGKEYVDVKTAKEYLVDKESAWYEPSNEYSSLFEKIFDLPTQRRRFVEHQVDGKLPSIGYSYLVELFQAGFFDTVFTTNFDDLINEAFYQFSRERPTLCAHDSSIKGLSVNSSRPKIVKIHGDYLFDSIKSTLNETESLESNTKDKLIEFTKKYGLIFIGYAGNDKSVMDVINHLLRQDDYLRNGIYWCFRKDDDINPELQKILHKERVYYLEIDGFDQALAEIHSYHNPAGLSLEANLKSSKRELMFGNFVQDNYQLSSNKYIREDLERLKKHTNKLDISNLISELSDSKFLDDGVTEVEFRDLLSLDNLIKNHNLDEAEKSAERQISICDNETLRKSYISRLISIFCAKEQYDRALIQMDKLLESDEYSISLHLKKSSLYRNISDRFDFVSGLLDVFKYSYSIRNEYINVCLEYLESKNPKEKVSLDKMKDEVEKSIRLDPSLDNPAWLLIEKVAAKIKESDGKVKNYIEFIESKIKIMEGVNPGHVNTLRFKSEFLCSQKSSDNKTNLENIDKIIVLINDINHIYTVSSKTKREEVIDVLLDIHNSLMLMVAKDKALPVITAFIDKYIKDESEINDVGLLLFKANYSLSYEYDLMKAKKIALQAVELNGSDRHVTKILDILHYGDSDIENCENIMKRFKGKISSKSYDLAQSQILTDSKRYDEALACLDKALAAGMHFNTYLVSYTFILLKEGSYQKVINLINQNIKYFDKPSEKNALIINREVANKMAGLKINKTDIRNAIGSDDKGGVSICGHILLGDEVRAKGLIDDRVNSNFSEYYMFSKWPAIPEQYLDKYKKMICTATADVVTLQRIA